MKDKLKKHAIPLGLIFLMASSFIAGVELTKEATGGEAITTEQYYRDSLQYLEDIRNSNDEILIELKKSNE